MIAILDYGAGNLRSVSNAMRVLGVRHEVVRDAPNVQRASKIILPGVGHFGQMMRSLDAMQLRDVLLVRIRAGVPFLGICLGLQALFESSEEAPDVAGLGLFPGRIRRFRGDIRVPHMGWNEIEIPRQSKLLGAPPRRPFVYFAHSYFAPPAQFASATCEYGSLPFTASIEQDNVFSVQFHPEKSGPIGLSFLQKFAEL